MEQPVLLRTEQIAKMAQPDMQRKEENDIRLEGELRKLLSQREIIQMLRELLML